MTDAGNQPSHHRDDDRDPGLAEAIALAGDALRRADALLIAAGAGMGVDSGLPDFRGPEGFWRAYPPYRALGLRFETMASPHTFTRDPRLAWGFYGHRLNLYRATRPHAGFDVLRRWAASVPGGAFVFTSNVDGHFQRAGFPDDRVVECHGSVHHLQCARPCGGSIWPADGVEVRVDEQAMRAVDPLPRCPRCSGLARPNVLMFGDSQWVDDRTDEQTARYRRWLAAAAGGRGRLVIVECGAGTAIPTVRYQSEAVADESGGTLIRINPREPHGPPGTIGLPLPARRGLEAIDRALS